MGEEISTLKFDGDSNSIIALDQSNSVITTISLDDLSSNWTTAAIDTSTYSGYLKAGDFSTATTGYCSVSGVKPVLNPEATKKNGLVFKGECGLDKLDGYIVFSVETLENECTSPKTYKFSSIVEEGWLCEFDIIVDIYQKRRTVYVSSDCLEYYVQDKNDIKKAVEEAVGFETDYSCLGYYDSTTKYYTDYSKLTSWATSTCSSSAATTATASSITI